MGLQVGQEGQGSMSGRLVGKVVNPVQSGKKSVTKVGLAAKKCRKEENIQNKINKIVAALLALKKRESATIMLTCER